VKITKSQLKQIIKEEISKALNEATWPFKSKQKQSLEQPATAGSSEEQIVHHNLFIEFMQEKYPNELKEFQDTVYPPGETRNRMFGEPRGRKAPLSMKLNKRFDKEIKWKFNYDPYPGLGCEKKLEFMNEISISFMRHPYMIDLKAAKEPSLMPVAHGKGRGSRARRVVFPTTRALGANWDIGRSGYRNPVYEGLESETVFEKCRRLSPEEAAHLGLEETILRKVLEKLK
tara:strand:- start:346 stop:1035 length:690 start_codon:yes stop_codon:yes gene_type:complete